MLLRHYWLPIEQCHALAGGLGAFLGRLSESLASSGPWLPRVYALAVMTERTCPKCGGRMEAGHLYDSTGEPIGRSSWSAKRPKRNVLTYLGLATSGPKEKDRRSVVTYRCDGCGYLESYAPTA